MKLKPLNRLLLCACLLSPCLALTPVLRAQDQEETAPEKKEEKKEREYKEEKEHKLEKRFESKGQPNPEPGAPMKVRERILSKKAQKPGTKIPFLGVVLGPVDESLGSQLGLPDGVGVLVRAVMDDSPAARSGVMQHDVLHYFNDQLLVNEPQLQTLVQQAGIGSEVKLTLFRKGKSESLTVKLGEILAQEQPELGREEMSHIFPAPGHGPKGYLNDARWTATAPYPENYERELREFQEKMQKHRGDTDEMRREIERFTDRMKEVAKKKQGVLFYRDNDGGDPKVRVQVVTDDDDGKGAVATAISSASGKDGSTIVTHNNTTRAKWKNDQGTGELTVENGRKQLTVKDADGKEIYSGPLDTKEQRMKLPPEVREQLERIEQGLKIEVRPALAPEPTKKQPEDS